MASSTPTPTPTAIADSFPLLEITPDRASGNSLKWGRYRHQDILPMWVADMDFMSPKPVVDALRSLTHKGNFGYGEEPQALRAVIATYLKTHFDLVIDPDWIIHLPGLVPGLNIACRMLEPGSAVVTHTPVYPPFLSAPANQNRALIQVPMRRDDAHWQLDFAALEKSLTPNTRLLLLCNPHNPTGRVFTREELETLAGIARRHDLLVCSDEIHCDLILEPCARHLPFVALDDDTRRRTITLMAPSKTFNLPGLGYSFALIPNPALRRRFVKAMNGIVPHPCLPGFVAAEAAYREGWPWLDQLQRYLRRNRDLAYARLSQLPELEVTCPEATYLMWIQARTLSEQPPCMWFEAAGVGLSDGTPFGDPLSVRLNFACARALLEQALERIEQFYRSHR